MDTVIRDSLFERDEPAEVFWFNCRVCGEPIMDPVKRLMGFCTMACLEAKRAADQAAEKAREKKKRKLARLLELE